MRIVWIACALACVFAAPVAADRGAPSESDLKGAFILHIRDGGELQLPDKQVLTLRLLAAMLERGALEYDRQAADKDPELSALPVVFHVEPTVPWHHVQTAMRIADERRCHRIWLARERNGQVEYVNVALPRGLPPVYLKARQGIVEMPVRRFPVYVVPKEIRPRPWLTEGGVSRAVQPTAATYLFGPGEDAGTLDEAMATAAAFATRARIDNPLAPMMGVLAAPPAMPSHIVLDAIRAFPPSLYRSVGILGAALPERDEWDRRRLAFPTFDANIESKAGLIGGDPRVTFSVAPWAVGSEVMPTSSKEVQPVPDFEAIDATVRMPLATGLARDKGPWAGDRIAINLTRSGQLRARGHQFSLRALGLYVRGLVTARKLDAEAGQLRVLLRVDGDAPWKHVQQLLTELHRSGVERVEFGVRGAATGGDSARDAARFDVLHRANEDDEQQYDAFFELLLDEWAGTRPSRFASVARSDVDRYQLDMLAEREVDAEWGPDGRTTHVRRPLDVRYEWEGKPYYDVRALIRVLVAARGAAFQKGALIRSSKLRVVVSASEKVPAKYVIAALARAKALHWGELWYFRRTEASEAAREALSLPYPKSNDLLQVRDGLEAGPRVPSEERR